MRKFTALQALIPIFLIALITQSGCVGKRPPRGGTSLGGEGDVFTQGELLGGDFLDSDNAMAMSGGRFDALPRVEGASFAPVYFGYDNYQIPASEYAKIEAAAQFLLANPTVVLMVEGHCDERGTNEYNMSLGEYRAQSIRAFLANAGVEPDRVQTTSYGEERPAVAGTGESVWRQNRRGEFAFYQR